MHQRFLVAAAAAVLAGCTTLTPERAQQMAQQTPDWELCYVMLSSKFPPVARQAVTNEVGRRRVDCNQHLQLVMLKMNQDSADEAQRARNAALGLQMLQAAQPRPAAPLPMPTQTRCRSMVVGNTLQTVCDTN